MLDELINAYGDKFLVAALGVSLALLCLFIVLWILRNRAPSPFVRGGRNRHHPAPGAGHRPGRTVKSTADQEAVENPHAPAGSRPERIPAHLFRPRARMSATMLDTYREVITPEGVPLHLPEKQRIPACCTRRRA